MICSRSIKRLPSRETPSNLQPFFFFVFTDIITYITVKLLVVTVSQYLDQTIRDSQLVGPHDMTQISFPAHPSGRSNRVRLRFLITLTLSSFLTPNFKNRFMSECHTLVETDLCPVTKDNCSTVHCVSLNSFFETLCHAVESLLTSGSRTHTSHPCLRLFWTLRHKWCTPFHWPWTHPVCVSKTVFVYLHRPTLVPPLYSQSPWWIPIDLPTV